MFKKFVSIMLSMLVFVMSMGIFTNAADTNMSITLQIDNLNMTVNDTESTIDAAPVIIDGRTLLPIRAVVEEMGGSVSWNNGTRQTTLNHGDSTIVLTIDSDTALLNDEEKTLDTVPVIINGRTFLPIRFIAESFGYNVEWNQEDKTIIITEMLAENDNKEVVSIVGDNNADSKNEVQSDSNTLIVYFSRTGTTKDLAEKIHNKIGGDIAEIVPVTPYPEDYNQCVDQAQEEINADARPEYTVSIDNITKYDTILVGYPIWWSSVPPVVRTFLDNSDLSDKTIMPFCTHGGSGISGSMSDIKKLCADSNITDGLDESSDDKVDAWLENNGL